MEWQRKLVAQYIKNLVDFLIYLIDLINETNLLNKINIVKSIVISIN